MNPLTVARGNEISYSTRFEERAQFASRVKHVHKLDHLHEAESYDSRLGVVAKAETIDKTRSDRYYVLDKFS